MMSSPQRSAIQAEPDPHRDRAKRDNTTPSERRSGGGDDSRRMGGNYSEDRGDYDEHEAKEKKDKEK